MIGRAESIAQLKEHLQKSLPGKLQVVFVTGPSGIGKSALIREVLEHTPAFYPVQYHYFESPAPPYAPFVHALRLLLPHFSLSAGDLSLHAHLGILLPEIKEEPTGSGNGTLTDAVREVLRLAAGRQPLCLVLEDCHWADAATLEMIPGLLEGLHALPITLLLTYRNDSVLRDHPLVKLRTQLRRQPAFSELKLPLLSREETGRLIEAQLESQASIALVGLIYAQTQGLPFFVKELTNALAAKGLLVSSQAGLALAENTSIPIPDTIRDMVALQLDGITESIREALELASLVGQEVELELLREILGNDQALDELFANPILLRKNDRTGVFTHSLVREVIRQEILWSKRKRLNLSIAAALEARQAPVEQVGQYWLEGGDKVRARLAFTEASRLYCRLHAHADAARMAHLALEIWPKGTDESLRLEVLHQFAGCTRVSGQVHSSILALRKILESPLIQEDHQKLGETYRALAISYALQGTWLHSNQCRRQAAECHEKAVLWAEAALDWQELANCCIDEHDIPSALESASRAVYCAGQTQKADLLAKVMSVKGYVLAIRGKGEEGTGMVREAIALALFHNHVEASAYAYRKLAGALEYSSDFSGSVRAYESALNYCRQENLDQQSQFCMTCMSWVLFRTGDWKRSLAVCREYLESPTINDASKALGHLVIGLIRLLRGETKTAGHYLQDARSLSIQANFHLLDPLLYWAMGMLHESENQPAKACQTYCQLLSYREKSGDVHDILPGLCSAISFFADHDYREECNQTVQMLSSIANQTGNAEAVGSLSYALGEMARYGRQYREATVHYAHAIRVFGELSVPQQLTVALYRKSASHLAAGEKTEAAEGLGQALQLAKPLGARPLIAGITALLEQATQKAVGTPYALAAGSALLAGLTGRQSEILGALVDGLSNKEIGVKLHLSTRTVDMHIRHIFDRLNCRTRAEAVRVAIEKKLLQPAE